jgi:FkbH-like protein
LLCFNPYNLEMTMLDWLPVQADWSDRMRAVEGVGAIAFQDLAGLAEARLDFLRTDRLDRVLARAAGGGVPVRVAVLGSSTLGHLVGAIRVAGLRHRVRLAVHQGEYGQYVQDLLGPDAGLAAFAPEFVLIALDAAHVTAGLRVGGDDAAVMDGLFARLGACWRAAKAMGAMVIQQAVLPSVLPLLGQNEHLLAGSGAGFVARFNARLRVEATAAGVMVLALDDEAARHGVSAFHDVVVWHRAKQDVAARAAPYYGDLVARLVAAARGKAAKCLVLDLDNTLWGGVIGDDGMEGIVLGQGSAEGEAFVAVQAYAKALAARGVALAVCSKNDDAVARAVFEQHPEMVLRLSDVACFVANWRDKASNIREIAATLSLGLDALVFLDDNPAERAQVRRELPEVRVIEMAEEPALVAGMLATCGYFESVAVTGEDFARSGQYAANAARREMAGDGSDMAGYLQSLAMRLVWRGFDRVGLARIVQLINKTNQFNLTTVRYAEDEVAGMIGAAGVFGLQFRLVDMFGDNGMIGVVILRDEGGGVWGIDSWLMSCRVLGRQVEAAMLGVVAGVARGLGAARLSGRFVASGRNDMVRDHYVRLGFEPVGDGFDLALDGFVAADVPMMIEEG